MAASRSGSVARVAAIASLAVALGAAGCRRGEKTASDAIREFVEAVQAGDAQALRCRLAGAAETRDGADFERWLASRYIEYEAGRDAGHVDLGDDGIPLVRAFALGKGTFWQVDATRWRDRRTLVADTTVRFGYPSIDLSGLSPGTVFYVCGAPVGRVHAVTVPVESGRVDLVVLDAVRVRWTLVSEPETGGCAGRWSVASVRPLDDSVVTARVAWVF